MTSFYEDNLNTARHELAHAVLAHLTGHYINGIEYTRTHGCTVIQRPVTPENVPLAYEQNAIGASMAVVKMVAILQAGAYAEVHGGQIGHAPRGQDLLDIEAWRERIMEMGGAEWWSRVLRESQSGLQSWFRHSSVQRAIATMAPVLVQAGSMSRWAMLSLFECGGVGTIPEPYFVPALRPVQAQQRVEPGRRTLGWT